MRPAALPRTKTESDLFSSRFVQGLVYHAIETSASDLGTYPICTLARIACTGPSRVLAIMDSTVALIKESATPSRPWRRLAQPVKNVMLIALSFVLLPFTSAFLCLNYARLLFDLPRWRTSDAGALHRMQPIIGSSGKSPARKILVTGVGMTKGLTLARLFHRAGHRVIGADFSPLACGSRSTALSAYYTLQRPGVPGNDDQVLCYLDSVLQIIRAEDVHLWISCSGVGSALEDGMVMEAVEARTGCRAVQFDVERTKLLHEKGSFMDHTRSLGLRVPESYLVRSEEEMVSALQKAAGLSLGYGVKGCKGRFIVKSVGTNDKSRGELLLLPLQTEEQTRSHIARLASLGISKEEPWLLQEFIDGPEYCTHSLVVRGGVKAFVACPSSELLMHYEALSPQSALSQAMLNFTREQAASFGHDFTGHLSFDFLVRGCASEATSPNQLELFAIECNPRAHTAVALFANTPSLVDQYLSVLDDAPPGQALDESANGHSEVLVPHEPEKYYWIGHDLVALVLLPTFQLLLSRISLATYTESVRHFAVHATSWKDGTFELWDPLPWWWLYHVYWPKVFWDSLVSGKNWSRINVSTTKMFESD